MKSKFTFHGRAKTKAKAKRLEKKCGKKCFILPKKIGEFFVVVRPRRS